MLLAALDGGPQSVRDLQDFAGRRPRLLPGRAGLVAERAVSPKRRQDPVRRDQSRPVAPLRA